MDELKPVKAAELTRWSMAERAVIGSMMIDPRCCGAVFQETSAEMFPDQVYRRLYEVTRRLWLEGQNVDPVAVCAAAGDGKTYAETIAEAMRETPTASSVESYCEILSRCLRFQSFRQAAYAILDASTLQECEGVWQQLGREIMGAEKVRCQSLAEAISGYLDRMNDATPPETFALGIKELDRLLMLRRGKFVILGADSSSGKTALALQFAYHVASTGKKVGFFSLETDNDTLTDRLMAEEQVAGVPLKNSKVHALRTIDYQRATEAVMSPVSQTLYLLDSCETLDDIRTYTIQMGFDFIVVDYLQLIDAPGVNRWDIVTNISMTLHRLARKLNITVLGLSQITPKGDGKPLTMDDLRESRQLKHDADAILLLELCKDFPNGRSLTIGKNKDGKRNRGMKLNFDPDHMTFSYYKRVETSAAPAKFEELDDNEGGELPFE